MLGPYHRRKWTVTSAAVLAAILVICVHEAAAEQNVQMNNSQPDLAALIQHITDAQSASRMQAKPYSVTREYKVFGEDAAHPRTQVLARVNFLPPNQKSYDIDRTTGGMGDKVIRRILDHEVDATRDPRDMIVDGQNYSFEYIGEDFIQGHLCYMLRVLPKHDRKELLNGTMWVDKNSYWILRMEGEPAKSPSFWVKDVHIVLQFGDVAGMWLQTGTHSTARVRFGGEYNIISQDLNYDVGSAVAVNSHPAQHPRRALIAAEVQTLH